MSTTTKNRTKGQEKETIDPPLSIISSNFKWYLISFVLIIAVALMIQRFRVNQGNDQRLFTADELRKFTKEELYLAILGHVFNVSSAPKFYSETGSYRFYTGRDASRSFHTGGTSDEDLTDDLTDLNDEAIAGIHHWLTFYQKQYTEIGKLVGRYFNSDGLPTKYFAQVLESVERVQKKVEEKTRLDQQWPPCNSEWSHTAGRRVWCSNKSGGIERNWVGVPRRLFDRSSRQERCVCVENPATVGHQLKEYPQCSPTSVECQIIEETDKN